MITMTQLRVGDRGKHHLPFSEVCMEMKVAGKEMEFELRPNGMVQLYDDDGQVFSFPITAGEAGVLWTKEDGYYYDSTQ